MKESSFEREIKWIWRVHEVDLLFEKSKKKSIKKSSWTFGEIWIENYADLGIFSSRVWSEKKWDEKKIENPHTKAFTCSCCFVWFSFILFSGCSSCDLFSVIFRSVASIFIDVLRRHWIAVRFGFICILLSRTHTNTHERRHRTQYEGIYYWKARIFVFKNVL